MNNPFNQLQDLVFSLEGDFDKWCNQGNAAAGRRLSQSMKQLKQQAVDIRRDVQMLKDAVSNERKQDKKPIPTKAVKPAVITSTSGTYQFEADDFRKVLGPISYNEHTVHTKFTDNQAANICGKMADAYARNVALKYPEVAHQVQGSIYRYQLHYLANKALAIYGGAVLTFLAGLRPLKFNNTSAYSIKRFVPVQNVLATEVDFPTLTFQSIGGNEFTLAFHLAMAGSKGRRPVQIFRNRIKVGSIGFRGEAFDASGNALTKVMAVKPSLLIFCDYLKSSKNPAFYSGVETGSCFVCGRLLTDPRSIRYGIGPTCLSRTL
ncbi:DUF6011 domain-containing protein [Hymenobacter sp. BT559]|uniref:DUF6011 domain-containing protein n=1 Tax=Hymenobacter sp. BT559 TaxID=2795729 RepID=UPI0018ED7605|nr:DUF6011 domain-containing protein [Hymenobacter sp. BT559]MBJ6146313.1 hypothetical protein [Hymenobacter sp. BT559]